MKKAISLLLALVLCLSLCACSKENAESSKSNEVILTLDNYKTYLNLDIHSFAPGDSDAYGFPGAPHCRSEYTGAISCTGASTNYDYNNIEITVKFTGTADVYENSKKIEYTIDKTETISCDIGGKGGSFVELFVGKLATRMIDEDSVKCSWEVVSISGSVSRIG